MLTGVMGNLGLSVGGMPFLADLRREEGLSAWARVARPIAARRGWKTVLTHSAPTRLRHWRRRLMQSSDDVMPSFWRGPMRLKPSIIDVQPFPHSGRAEVFRAIEEVDMSDPAPGWFHGLRWLDPTADRRLVELCLRVPARLLIDASEGRPLYEAAFADLLPPELLRERRRGRQGADWWIAFDPTSIRAALEDVAGHPLVAEAIDVAAMEHLLERWPKSFEQAFAEEAEFDVLLRTVSLAFFLAENF
jgi:asparagine synthase (glutamine-hydrolysing)